jgi:hypothetical protein
MYVYSVPIALQLSAWSVHGILLTKVHCKEDPIYVFTEMKLRGLVPNSYIHVSVSDLYITTIGLPIVLNRSQIHECRNWERGRAVSFLGIIDSNFRYRVFAVYTEALHGCTVIIGNVLFHCENHGWEYYWLTNGWDPLQSMILSFECNAILVFIHPDTLVIPIEYHKLYHADTILVFLLISSSFLAEYFGCILPNTCFYPMHGLGDYSARILPINVRTYVHPCFYI